MITEGSKNEILEIARVEDVVGDFVSLRRRGANLLGLCPFHNEKTPSFNVNPARNIYKCFGCGKAGDPVSFLMEHEHLTFPESLRWLAKKYGIKVEEKELSAEDLVAQQRSESLFIANQYAAEYYQDQLFSSDQGRSVGLSYFRQRGFSEETIRNFSLGFAPAGGDAFLVQAIKLGFDPALLESLGLVKNGRDFFRDRVLFPIHNLSGKVVGFGGRILKRDAKAPKYLNSPETEVYNKSRTLYGAHFARQAIRQLDQCLLVEGYTDVISLHQAGIRNVVATSGTALTVDQIRLIQRLTENVVLLYDGDPAGIRAALRGVDLILEQNMNVRIVVLPEGQDPDSFVQLVGAEDFNKYLAEKAEDFIFFKSNLLLESAGSDPVKKAGLIKDIVSSIARVQEPLKRSLYVKECAKLFDVEEVLLIGELNKQVSQQLVRHQQRQAALPAEPKTTGPVPAPPAPGKDQPFAGHDFQERDLVRMIVTAGHKPFEKEGEATVAEYILANIEDVLNDFDNILYKKIIEASRDQLAKGALSVSFFLHHSDQAIKTTCADLLTSPFEYSDNWEKRWDIALNQKAPDDNFFLDTDQALKRFRMKKILRMCEQNVARLREWVEKKDEEQIVLHMKVQQRLQAIRDELARELGTVVF
jgi:DNA primase